MNSTSSRRVEWSRRIVEHPGLSLCNLRAGDRAWTRALDDIAMQMETEVILYVEEDKARFGCDCASRSAIWGFA